jgi:hypothetical protein
MKKCAPRSTKNKKPTKTLEFPVAPDFVSRPATVDPQAMLRRIAENMQRRKLRPGEAERRAAEKIPVEFVL